MGLSPALSTVLFLSTLQILPCAPVLPRLQYAETLYTGSGKAGKGGNIALETAESSAKVPIELILTGNVQKDQVLLPLLHSIRSFPSSQVRLQPSYHLSSRKAANETANANMQICVFRLGSSWRFLEFMLEWLWVGKVPALERGLELCAQANNATFWTSGEDYQSEFPAPGVKVANHYYPPSLPISQFLALLSANTSPARGLGEDCSPGCTSSLYISRICVSACNVPACDYQNWTCACAPHCTSELLANAVCDPVCSFPACDYDNQYCPSSTIPANYTPYENPALRNNSEPEWAKWVIVALSLLVLV